MLFPSFKIDRFTIRNGPVRCVPLLLEEELVGSIYFRLVLNIAARLNWIGKQASCTSGFFDAIGKAKP